MRYNHTCNYIAEIVSNWYGSLLYQCNRINLNQTILVYLFYAVVWVYFITLLLGLQMCNNEKWRSYLVFYTHLAPAHEF